MKRARYVSRVKQNDFNDINNQKTPVDKERWEGAQPPQMRLRTYKLRAALASGKHRIEHATGQGVFGINRHVKSFGQQEGVRTGRHGGLSLPARMRGQLCMERPPTTTCLILKP